MSEFNLRKSFFRSFNQRTLHYNDVGRNFKIHYDIFHAKDEPIYEEIKNKDAVKRFRATLDDTQQQDEHKQDEHIYAEIEDYHSPPPLPPRNSVQSLINRDSVAGVYSVYQNNPQDHKSSISPLLSQKTVDYTQQGDEPIYAEIEDYHFKIHYDIFHAKDEPIYEEIKNKDAVKRFRATLDDTQQQDEHKQDEHIYAEIEDYHSPPPLPPRNSVQSLINRDSVAGVYSVYQNNPQDHKSSISPLLSQKTVDYTQQGDEPIYAEIEDYHSLPLLHPRNDVQDRKYLVFNKLSNKAIAVLERGISVIRKFFNTTQFESKSDNNIKKSELKIVEDHMDSDSIFSEISFSFDTTPADLFIYDSMTQGCSLRNNLFSANHNGHYSVPRSHSFDIAMTYDIPKNNRPVSEFVTFSKNIMPSADHDVPCSVPRSHSFDTAAIYDIPKNNRPVPQVTDPNNSGNNVSYFNGTRDNFKDCQVVMQAIDNPEFSKDQSSCIRKTNAVLSSEEVSSLLKDFRIEHSFRARQVG